jgi:hypothetical protein
MDQNQMTGIAVSRSYSLTMTHIVKISELARRLGISQGEVVRRAIDMLYQAEAEKEEVSDVKN